MRAIEMVDLKVQHEIIGEELQKAIGDVMNSTRFIKGPEVGKFEKELGDYLGNSHIISCGNGTDALQIALMALGLRGGDEVITTNFTFVATAEVVALLGLKLVLVDVDPFNYNISVEDVRRAITSRTKAIIPVHLFGQCAEMDPLISIAREKNLYLVEDAAQAMGTEYIFSNGDRKKAGTIGTVGATSFFPSKNLACCGDGGAIITENEDLATEARCIANHGSRIKYYNERVGVNSRLDTLQAAILSVKLKYLNLHNRARVNAAEFYDKKLGDNDFITIPKRESYSSHIFHQYTVRVKNGKRDELKQYLADAGIPSMVYYPVPLHKQKAYTGSEYDIDDFAVSSALCNEVLSLPMHPELDPEQMDYIVNRLLDFFG